METQHFFAILIACATGTSSMAAQLLATDTLSETARAQSMTPKKSSLVFAPKFCWTARTFPLVRSMLPAAKNCAPRTAVTKKLTACRRPAVGRDFAPLIAPTTSCERDQYQYERISKPNRSQRRRCECASRPSAQCPGLLAGAISAATLILVTPAIAGRWQNGFTISRR